MARTLRLTSAPGGPWYEYYRETCPICGRRGMCMVHEDGEKVVCNRQASEIEWAKNSALPGWLHSLNGERRRKVELDDVETASGLEKKPEAHLNRVYRALLSELSLRNEHTVQLKSPTRDMTDEEIMIRQYRSFPRKPWEAVKQVIDRLGGHDDLIGVPGFYTTEGKYGRYFTLSGYPQSILVPFRNIKNEIVGFQWRVDEVRNQITFLGKADEFSAYVKEQPNYVVAKYKEKVIFEGTMELKEEKLFSVKNKQIGRIKIEKGNRYMWLSSARKESGTGAGPLPVHVAVPTRILRDWKVGSAMRARVVTVTEGPIKADKSAEKLDELLTKSEQQELGKVVLSVPGINSWRILLPILKEMGVETVNLAFDMDANTNNQVKQQLFACAKALKEMNYKVNLMLWEESEGKGLDDLLIQNIVPRIFKV